MSGLELVAVRSLKFVSRKILQRCRHVAEGWLAVATAYVDRCMAERWHRIDVR